MKTRNHSLDGAELWPVPKAPNPAPRVAKYLAACAAGNAEYQRTGSIVLAEREWMRVRTLLEKKFLFQS